MRGRKAWFFKLWGDADLALQEKERFLSLVKSVKFEAQKSSTAASASERSKPAVKGRPGLKYTTPDGWSPAKVGGMRKAAFGIKEGDKAVEMTVIDLSLTAGALLPNVNRWRDQIQLKAITQEELNTQMRPIEVDGETGHLVELIGPKEADRPQAILGVVLLRQDRSWFFKMIGDADLVTRERGRFEEFVNSVTFAVAGDDHD